MECFDILPLLNLVLMLANVAIQCWLTGEPQTQRPKSVVYHLTSLAPIEE